MNANLSNNSLKESGCKVNDEIVLMDSKSDKLFQVRKEQPRDY